MRKVLNSLISLVVLLSLFACSKTNEKEWSYQLEGKSDNWKVVLNAVPVTEEGKRDFLGPVAYIVTLEKLSDKKIIEDIHYEMTNVNSHSSGGLKKDAFENKNPIQILVDTPSPDSNSEKFKKGMSLEELEDIFYKNYIELKWKDEKGEQYEKINLNIVKPE